MSACVSMHRCERGAQRFGGGWEGSVCRRAATSPTGQNIATEVARRRSRLQGDVYEAAKRRCAAVSLDGVCARSCVPGCPIEVRVSAFLLPGTCSPLLYVDAHAREQPLLLKGLGGRQQQKEPPPVRVRACACSCVRLAAVLLPCGGCTPRSPAPDAASNREKKRE